VNSKTLSFFFWHFDLALTGSQFSFHLRLLCFSFLLFCRKFIELSVPGQDVCGRPGQELVLGSVENCVSSQVLTISIQYRYGYRYRYTDSQIHIYLHIYSTIVVVAACCSLMLIQLGFGSLWHFG